jgi:AraC-like DNA-binding protein
MFFLKSKRNGATHREQQLAQESGYHSYSTFSAAFRQRMHKNVTDWMREEVFLQM